MAIIQDLLEYFCHVPTSRSSHTLKALLANLVPSVKQCSPLSDHGALFAQSTTEHTSFCAQ